MGRKRAQMVGAGGLPGVWIRQFLPASADRIEVVALVDVNPTALAASRDMLGLPPNCRLADMDDAFAVVEADLCILAVPPGARRNAAALAVGRSLPMLCEKPIADSWGNSLAIVRMADDAAVKCSVVQNYRYTRKIMTIKRALDEGSLGRVNTLHCRFATDTAARPRVATGGSMANQDIHAARRFHDGTKHPGGQFFREGHVLDPATRPLLFKIYSTLEPIALPSTFTPSSLPALDAIRGVGATDGERVPDLATIARVLFFSNGITRHIRRGGRVWPFRAAPCTGALYHVELYVVCGDLPGLPAGVYHFGAHDNGLRRLRSGDFREVLVNATASEPSVARAPSILVATSTFWRNSWKYQARAYRHTFWDTGTMLPNTLAVATAAGLPGKVVVGFVDEAVNRLLDVDGQGEFAVVLIPLGQTDAPPPAAPAVEALDLPTEPLSSREVDEPEIRAMHAASSLASTAEVSAWRGGTDERPSAPPSEHVPLPEPLDRGEEEPKELPREPVETVILRRGSTRRFAREPITLSLLSMILRGAASSLPTDFSEATPVPLNDAYLIVNAVDGLAAGTYLYRRDRHELQRLATGDFRERASHLALDQDLGGDAAVNIYYLTDLERVLARFGNRGYRAAQLEAAMSAGQVYLASYALGLGATGLTFLDNAVTEFFSPHAAGKSVMFLVAIGHPLRAPR